MKKFILAIITLSLFLSACRFGQHKVRGNGQIISKSHNVEAFSNLDVSGNFEVHVTQDSSHSVKVEADENLMQYILVTSRDNTLHVEPEENINLDGSKKIKVYISSPSLKNIDLSGACNIIAADTVKGDVINIQLSGASDAEMALDAPKISSRLTGASGLKLRGKTKDFSIDGSGAMRARCTDLLAENVDVDISGAGSAHVFASIKLNAHVSGAGSIRYRGNATVQKEVSGAGSVSKED